MQDKGCVQRGLKSRVKCVGDESTLAANTVTNRALQYQRALSDCFLTAF